MTMARFHTTVTERSDFRTCRRRWYLGVHENLRPKGQVTWYLIFGDCIHSAMDAYYRPKTSRSRRPPRDLALAIDAFEQAWNEKDDDLRHDFAGLYSQGIEEEWHKHKERGVQMLIHYDKFDKIHPFFDKVIAVGVEERAFVDILRPDGEPIPSLPLLSGRIDLVVEKETGVWIVDHKALAGAPNDRALDVDDQLTAYCYIWWRLTGQRPRGAYYNVLIKDPPKPPKVLVSGQLSQDKAQRTTRELYRETMKELGIPIRTEKVDYTEMLNYLAEKGWHQFYQRLGPVMKTEEQLLSFQTHLYHEYLDMSNALAHPDMRYIAGSQYVCPGCPMMMLCQTMEERGNVDYVRNARYEEVPPRVEIPSEVLSPKWKGV